MIKIKPVILCGGSGTRLWPLSRFGFPKQFICLSGRLSLFQEAVKRLFDLSNSVLNISSPIIVTNEEHRFLAQEQLREINISTEKAILEPVGRNTAPALTLAALAAIQDGDDPILVVTPSDYTIKDGVSFNSAINDAVCLALDGNIVILGVKPSKPETGYGYIKAVATSASAYKVEKFVEKPTEEKAYEFILNPDYFWNAGIFIIKASVWLQAVNIFNIAMLNAIQLAWNHRVMNGIFVRFDPMLFAAIPCDSIDYAVMEHCPTNTFPVYMVPLDAGWDDLGGWEAVWNILPKDENGNAHIGDVVEIGSNNTLVYSTSRLVSLVGVQDLVIVETPDAVLVLDKAFSQEVKDVVNLLHLKERSECIRHCRVYRPWGWFDTLEEGNHFKVKRIQVKPKASLSLQMHRHRAEHWIVVRGTAQIVCGDKKFLLTENQSTFIPLGEVHRLTNPCSSPLELIEVQSGDYLGEDDIIRIDDHYGREEG